MDDPLTDAELSELERLTEAAAPAPWVASPQPHARVTYLDISAGCYVIVETVEPDELWGRQAPARCAR